VLELAVLGRYWTIGWLRRHRQLLGRRRRCCLSLAFGGLGRRRLLLGDLLLDAEEVRLLGGAVVGLLLQDVGLKLLDVERRDPFFNQHVIDLLLPLVRLDQCFIRIVRVPHLRALQRRLVGWLESQPLLREVQLLLLVVLGLQGRVAFWKQGHVHLFLRLRRISMQRWLASNRSKVIRLLRRYLLRLH